jgi:hypothetical protein
MNTIKSYILIKLSKHGVKAQKRSNNTRVKSNKKTHEKTFDRSYEKTYDNSLRNKTKRV